MPIAYDNHPIKDNMEQIEQMPETPVTPLTDEELAALLAQPVHVTDDAEDEKDEALVLN